ncbi:DUF262 domain-containing protein [Cupriavidus basilensis]|uniref:DUF262 domain-containing protein n=1 Tax=Cupriavidus basilensis TaxID=68895 RepID=A0ABT6B5C1_9BURK|nr:DUF262 domain-containing protein [Cupriavidus basilensis]MDF3840074.1 DUF262 domain-containing protein [Cupriavidus basilensis]
MLLLKGEVLLFPADVPASIAKIPDDVINEKYVRGEIRIVTEQARYPLSTIASIVESPTYRLSPEYQRRHRWTRNQQSRLIESLIMNVPIPPIFLYEYDYSKYEVMDGLQRLTAIHAFYRDEFSLADLTQWPELNGRTYSALPEKVREGIDRRYLSSVILLKETARNEEDALRLKQMVFERINSGGARLTPQETRNAIYDGPLNRLCIRLSKSQPLCRLWGLPLPDAQELDGGSPPEERLENDDFRRMEDVELVLRFFAFRQKRTLHKSTVPLSAYLDSYLYHGNGFDQDTLQGLECIFIDTIQLVEDVFGERSFWLYRQRRGNWSWLERPTTTIYDSLMAVASQHLDKAQLIRNKAQILRDRIESFYRENYDTFEGRNVNPSALIARESALEKFLIDTIKTA